MKLIKKKDKTNNGVMTLLRRLKRHDTMVVAVAVVIALVLCGGLIYISTPVVAAEAKEEFIESERENNELTKEKLQEIRDYLDELDKVVTSNQSSLSSIDEKTGSTEMKESLNKSLSSNADKLHNQSAQIKSDTQKIIVETEKITNIVNEKVTALDGKLDEVHRNINNTIARIDTVKSELEAADKKNAEQIRKDFDEIGKDLEKIQRDYENATKQTKDLLTELNEGIAENIDSGTETIKSDISEKNAALLTKINEMYSQMEQFNTGAFAGFRQDITNLSSALNLQLQNLDSDLKGYNQDVKNKFDSVNSSVGEKFSNMNTSIGEKFDSVNNSIGEKFDNVSSSMTTKIDEINQSMNSQTDAINSLISENASKSQESNKALSDKLAGIETKVDQVFQRVSEDKNTLASTLLTYNVNVGEDAKFGQINEGIKELGERSNNKDSIINAAKSSVTAEKILAGQTVTVDNITIEGTATSDANASAADLLSGKTAYVNGQMVQGQVPLRNIGNVVLTSSNNTQHFEAGYYEAFTVTSDAAGIPGSIMFQIGHTHTGSETSGTGCYTTKDESRSWVCGARIDLDDKSWKDGNGTRHYTKEGSCPRCGAYYTLSQDGPGTINCGRGETFYLRSCGHEEGELIRETSDISDVGENEKLLSATITMD